MSFYVILYFNQVDDQNLQSVSLLRRQCSNIRDFEANSSALSLLHTPALLRCVLLSFKRRFAREFHLHLCALSLLNFVFILCSATPPTAVSLRLATIWQSLVSGSLATYDNASNVLHTITAQHSFLLLLQKFSTVYKHESPNLSLRLYSSIMSPCVVPFSRITPPSTSHHSSWHLLGRFKGRSICPARVSVSYKILKCTFDALWREKWNIGSLACVNIF